MRQTLHAPVAPSEEAEYDKHVETVRAAIGEQTFQALYEAGRLMTPELAAACALEPDSGIKSN